jgi:DNA invertase Pin-like site-specific DNA recombinase
MPKAYSYLRFSTPEQQRGDSFRRQATMATDYALRHGLELDDKSYSDLGISAFHGKNAAADGALGQFVAAVKSHLIPADSHLLVESLDRVSRQDVGDALDLLQSIVKLGVTVVTLNDGQAYTRERLRTEPMSIVLAVFGFARANEESAMKSRRVRAAWQHKRDNASARPLTAVAPGWLRLIDGKFEVIPERADLVRRIFSMSASGRGKTAIARTLNAEGVPTWKKGNGWHAAVVHQILSNPAVIGRYQPHTKRHEDGSRVAVRKPAGPPIEGYFPAILDSPGDFYRTGRGVSGKGASAPVNALAGLARCASCGGAMHYVGGGISTPKPYAYLACDGQRRRGTCAAKAVRYDVVIEALLLAMEDGEINLRGILAGGASERQQELQRDLEATDGRIAEAEAGVARLLDVLERLPASAAIEARLAETEATLGELRQRKVELEREVRLAASEASGDDAAGNVFDVLADARAGGGDTVTKLNAALSRLVQWVSIGHGDHRVLEPLAAIDRWGQSIGAWTDDRQAYLDITARPMVSIVVIFRARDRHLIIAADRKTAGTFVAGIMRERDGKVEGGGMKVFP